MYTGDVQQQQPRDTLTRKSTQTNKKSISIHNSNKWGCELALAIRSLFAKNKHTKTPFLVSARVSLCVSACSVGVRRGQRPPIGRGRLRMNEKEAASPHRQQRLAAAVLAGCGLPAQVMRFREQRNPAFAHISASDWEPFPKKSPGRIQKTTN